MDYVIRLADQLRPHIRALRKQAGITQAQLGARLGLGQARIAEIEADPGVVSVEQLLRLLAALDAALVLRDGAVDPVPGAAGATSLAPAAAPTAVVAEPASPAYADAAPPSVQARSGGDAGSSPTDAAAATPAAPAATARPVVIAPRKGSW
ncbi:helix-turn-helix domain-containing protein [Derxia lacustris]|uniref:helix-turn-helix domain-containing protein n=1 Tax=Derxia lacustris TaxID=764842 RepID=UPI000A177E35|nr:helix-turn-helix transcriptional regulator [Derxia lacustris]